MTIPDGKAIVITGSGRGIGAVDANDSAAAVVAEGAKGIACAADVTKWEGAGRRIEKGISALIGEELNDRLVSGLCRPASCATGVILGGQITGGTTSGPAGISQVGCFVDPVGEVWLRATEGRSRARSS